MCHHTTKLPVLADETTALAVLHDHAAMMRLGQHHYRFEEAPPDPDYPGYTAYTVTDTIPLGLWSTQAVSTYYHYNLDNGVDTIIKAPLGVLLDISRRITGADGEKVLEENVNITCPWLMGGVMQSQVESNCGPIHDKYLVKLKERASK